MKRMKLSPPPARFNAEKKFRDIYWFQKWEAFEGCFTPGVNCIATLCKNLGVPADLRGKRVLDVGAWNGCLSFECERRGASEVIALSPEDPAKTGFNALKKWVGSTRTRYVKGSVYDLDPRELGYFDVIFFCGVLYHLRYPLLGIDNLRRVAIGDVYVETFVIDSQMLFKEEGTTIALPMKAVSPRLLFTPLWQFFKLNELNRDPSNWFGPNETAVIEAFESAGFSLQSTRNSNGRATFRGRVKPGQPEFLKIRSCEGVYHDTLIGHLFGKEKLTHRLAPKRVVNGWLKRNPSIMRAGGVRLRQARKLFTDLSDSVLKTWS